MLSNLKDMRRYRHVVKPKRYEKVYTCCQKMREDIDMLSKYMRRYRLVVKLKRYQNI